MSEAVLEGASCAVEREAWGVDGSGAAVSLYHLRNGNGMHVGITNLGGIITSIEVPDRDGELADVVLGFDSLDGYLAEHPYFGAIVGRYANRIANGTFAIAGIEYQLDVNNESNHLHGGFEGFDSRVWDVESVEEGEQAVLRLSLVSPDGDQGFPGELRVIAVYTLTGDNVLRLELEATSSSPTICNLTQHSYFNLNGADGSSVLDHDVKIESDAFLPVTERLIPHGPAEPVAESTFDFREFKSIGLEIEAECEQLRLGGGYDHNWLVSGEAGTLRLAATARSKQSGRSLELWTTDPGVQFYTGNFLDGTLVGKGGHAYPRRSGFCLEPQLYPNSPNNADYPSSLLMPGETYRHQMEYRFATVEG